MPTRGLLALTLLLGALVAARPAVAGEEEVPAGTPRAASDEEREAVRRMVAELRADASRLRGLEWKKDVPADLLTRDQLRANFEALVKEEMKPEELARDTRIVRRLGLLEPDEDLLALAMSMMEEMVAGYYNPKEGHLYLIEGMAGDAQRPVILHELIHALEDQHLGLQGRTERWKEHSDRLFAEKCVEEGSAEHARELYQRENPEITKLFLADQANPANLMRQLKVFQRVPAFLITGTLLHYDLGPKLVTRFVGDDYAGGIAKLYEDGPVSQEQLLHAARWLGDAKDYPQTVVWAGDLAAAAGEGWTRLHDMPAGELDLALYLDHFLGGTDGKLNVMLVMQGRYVGDRARGAAEGWDAGQWTFLEKEGRGIAWCQALAFDRPEDAREAAEAFVEAIRKASGPSFEGGSFEDDEGARVAEWVGPHGRGRIRVAGERVLLLDGGLDDEAFGRVWEVLLATRFEKDARDTFDAEQAPDDLAGLDFADREKGVGLRYEEAGWKRAWVPDPQALLVVQKEGVLGALVLQGAPMDLESIRPFIETSLRAQFPGFDPEARQAVPVGPSAGWRYHLGQMPGQDGSAVVYLGRASGAIVILRFLGTPEALAARATDMDDLAKAVVVVER